MISAVVCDDYKVETFKKVLADAGYVFTIHPLSGNLKGNTSIKVVFEQHKFNALKVLIHKTEISFKQSN